MNKTYYPNNLVTTISNSQLRLIYKRIGFDLFKLTQTYTNFSETTIGTTVDLASVITQLQEKIILFFQAINNIDPMLVLTCKYYYYNSTKNIISKIKSETHPLYNLFTITLSDVYDKKHNFIIEINEKELTGFLTTYVYYQNPDLVTNNVIFNFKYLFVGALQNFLQTNIDTGTDYTYEHYSVNMHTTKNVSQLNTQGLYHDFESEYNFFIKNYETLFSGSSMSQLESIIPNYYAIQLYLDAEDGKKLHNLVTLENNVETTKQSILSKDYFIKYADYINSLDSDTKSALNKVKNYLLDSYYSSQQNNSLSSENFPYTTKIKFSNYPVDSLIEVLENKKLDTLTVNNCHYIFANNANQTQELIPQTQTFYIKQQNIFKKPSNSGDYIGVDGNTYDLNIKNVFSSESVSYTKVQNIFDFVAFSSSLGGFNFYNQQDFSFFSKENLKYIDMLKKPASIFHYIYLKNHLELIYNRSLNYSNVLDFEPLDVYPLCFQVEKNNDTNTISNTISVARNSTNSEISLYDTQVAYEKKYNYKIYSINLVNSIKYKFSELNRNLIKNTLSGVVTLSQNSYIYKNIIIDKKFQIFDNPPTPIDVNIVPLINSTNKMLFLLNTQSTTLLEEPKIIKNEDAVKFLNIRKKQNLNSKKVFFETVEDLRAVQVFRTTTQPQNYKSFENSLYKVISLQKTTSNSFIDTVQQNVKYYYTFRAVDVHNNFSNPTEIFEVQIINNDGAIYPIVKTFNSSNINKNFIYNKSFKKYISVNPSILFTELTNSENEQIQIGTESGFWNEKYKLRIKSKQSGKSFDINLTFKKVLNNLIDKTNTFDNALTAIDTSLEDVESNNELVIDSNETTLESD